MKKALALVLALVLALSMGVSAFAAILVPLFPTTPAPAGKVTIPVVSVEDNDFYVYEGGSYYFALEDAAWEDIKLTANGCITAELVEFDPEKMVVTGMDVFFKVTCKGEDYATNLDYEYAKAYAKDLNDAAEVTYYAVAPQTNVNIIKLTVANNYGVHYEKGTLKIEATLNEVPFAAVITIINDVVIFEYEEVKWTAKEFKNGASLKVNQNGYSDFISEAIGYDEFDYEYSEIENRLDERAAVISTTAFRAIEGKNITIVYDAFFGGDADYEMAVVLKEIAAGQKGVNFQAYAYPVWEDDGDLTWEYGENLTSIELGFYGEQIIKGEYEITIDLNRNWFQLREDFGIKVEEDDIISYYLVDANGKVVGGKEVDYMTADLSEDAVFTISGENAKLGQYSLVLEVPAVESGEENPNTGAESVVGVVAALAVVSVATAAAVSLKK